MKKSTRFIHKISRELGLDGFFATASERFDLARKFVPEPWEYSAGTTRVIKRGGVVFCVELCDYMQWHVFANILDPAYLHAHDSIKARSGRSVILDVGANIGAFSLKLANLICLDSNSSANIYSFEPNPVVADRFEENLRLNPALGPLISIRRAALGANVGSIGLSFEKLNSGGGRVVESQLSSATIPMTTIDDFVVENGIRKIDFMKIDVEGYEPFVLDGARESLNEFRPDLFIEITPEWFKSRGRSEREIFDTLKHFGYKIYLSDGEILSPLELFVGREPSQFNILATQRGLFL